jgi:hypothetical protein
MPIIITRSPNSLVGVGKGVMGVFHVLDNDVMFFLDTFWWNRFLSVQNEFPGMTMKEWDVIVGSR